MKLQFSNFFPSPSVIKLLTEYGGKMNWKNVDTDRKSFGSAVKIWQKNTSGRAAFLESLQSAIVL